jgi:outer membrane lipoprotein-sorting protein
MSRYFLLLSLCITLVPLARAQQLTADEEKALLAKLRDHRTQYPALTADFSEERTTRLLNKPLLSTGTIAFRTPNKFRRELKGGSPSLTVSNGTELWIYYPNFKEAEHYTLGRKQFFDDSLAALTAGMNFHDVEKFFRITASHDGAGYRIALAPKTSSLRRILVGLTVSLDAGGVIEKTEAILPKGDRVLTRYRNVRPSRQSDGKFDFTPPPDAHVSTPLGN